MSILKKNFLKLCVFRIRPVLIFFSVTLFFICKCIFAIIAVYDDTNHKIILQKPAQRIITLSPEANDFLLALKAKNKIIGTIAYEKNLAIKNHSVNIGIYPNIDFEKLVILRPDLVILSNFGVPAEITMKLKEFNIPYFFISPKKITFVASDIKKIGALIGKNKTATKISEDFQNNILLFTKKFKLAKKVTVFYQLWGYPLTTVGKKTIIDKIITLCGGESIFTDLNNLSYPVISVSNVLIKNPDVIIGSIDASMDYWHKLTNLSAVKNNHVYYIDPNILQKNSPLLAQGIKTMCKQINLARQ